MSGGGRQFAHEWQRLAALRDRPRVAAIAGRLCSEPAVHAYFPYASHNDVRISRNDEYPWDDEGLPHISSRADNDVVYEARDGTFRPRVEGDLDTVARAFLALLDELPQT